MLDTTDLRAALTHPQPREGAPIGWIPDWARDDLVSGKEVVTNLATDLARRVPELHIAGDCLAPRRINHAVLDGYRIGRSL